MSSRDDLIRRLHLVWDDEVGGWRGPTNDTWQTLPFRVLVAAAVDCARSIIEDGAATDEELADLLPVAEQALEAPATVELTDRQIEALSRVAALGTEYMTNCGYADDPDWPEDQLIARSIGNMREEAFTYALTRNFGRRWHD